MPQTFLIDFHPRPPSLPRWSARLRLVLLAVAGIAFSAAAQAPADVRVALVIGNAAYAMAPLANPANDARSVGEVLRTKGFTVIEARNAGKAEMDAALVQASGLLKGRHAVAMLYYAGHGLQLDWRNYMVPVDARLARASDVPLQTMDVQTVLDAFRSAGTRMNIVVLDACRDNPFEAPPSGKGLAPMDAPPGTLLAFATAPGNVAQDGSEASGNGLYTRFLVREINQPGARIEDVFKRVRLQVRKESQGRQVPWESTSLEDDFYFSASGVAPAAQSDADRLAVFRLEKADWDRIKDSKNADDFYAFLNRYPNGMISEKAQFQLDRIQAASIRPEPGRDGIVKLQGGAARYRVGDSFHYASFDVYGKEQRPRRVAVTAITEEGVLINGGEEVWDAMGNLVVDRNGRRNPAKAWFPAEISTGKRWRSAYEIVGTGGAKNTVVWDFRVTGLERVPVPAGMFQAYRIEGFSKVSNGAYQTETYWIDPSTFLMVKDEWLRRRGSFIEDSYRRELVSVARARE